MGRKSRVSNSVEQGFFMVGKTGREVGGRKAQGWCSCGVGLLERPSQAPAIEPLRGLYLRVQAMKFPGLQWRHLVKAVSSAILGLPPS